MGLRDLMALSRQGPISNLNDTYPLISHLIEYLGHPKSLSPPNDDDCYQQQKTRKSKVSVPVLLTWVNFIIALEELHSKAFVRQWQYITMKKIFFWSLILIFIQLLISHGLRLKWYTLKMWAHKEQWISHKMNNRHPWQLKKIKNV